ncbi:transposon Tf2-9 polyprotein [Nephila pilipes]|uniref:Transposon Tf2-9 polyprotein n=1 Tax=Nephila pilipes TaxID=299642 RepID=A0A8X6P4V1_NEPPI|nr:transposon Tf2-9 polyprotein [Nephila pilipes]
MLAQAQTNEAKTITHSIILSKFITSLPQNFQRKLSSKNPSTLKEAIDIAVRMQPNSETHTTCSMLLQPDKTVNTEKDSITKKLDELTTQITMLKTEKTKTEVSQHISYRTPQQNTLPRHTVSCSFCGKPNHLMKDCWKFLRSIHTTPNQQQYSWPQQQQQSYWPLQQQHHNRFQSRGSSYSNTRNYNRNTNYQQTFPKQIDSRNSYSKLIGDSLTNSPSHLDTQTNEELKQQTPHELIMNVNQQSPLPMIHVNIADEQLIFLIDSGSSISLIPGHIFDTIKHKIQHKSYLSRRCANIGTISTEVTIEEQINEQSSVNAIQATADIIEKRCQDLKEADFPLDHFNPKDKNLLLSTLLKFKPAFSKCIKTLGHCDLVTPTISTIHPHPISSKPYPILQSLQTHAQNFLEELIAADIIEENTAECASPMVLVKKKNHTNDNPSLRLALDLRLLNNVIDGCSYALPKIQDITTKLGGFKLFTVLDLNSVYWQIHLPKEYRKFLTFTTPWKHFNSKDYHLAFNTQLHIFKT